MSAFGSAGPNNNHGSAAIAAHPSNDDINNLLYGDN
jgi:hypothetical protein